MTTDHLSTNASTKPPLEIVLFAMAGTVTLASALLAVLVSPWFLLLDSVRRRQRVAVRARRRLPVLGRAAQGVPSPAGGRAMSAVGPIGRLGRFTATHVRAVVLAWVVLAVGLGALAPRVESALSGAGWEATGSASVKARSLIQQHFAGNSSSAIWVVVHSPTRNLSDPAFAGTLMRVERILGADHAIASVTAPRPGTSISRDGHTAIVLGGAARSPKQMVSAAERLKGPRSRPPAPPTSRSTRPARRRCGLTSTPPTAPR